MKNKNFFPDHFEDLTSAENFCFTGGGFAYDIGRLIRFAIISGPGASGVANGIGDAIWVMVK